MVSQAAVRLLGHSKAPGEDGKVDVTLVLACGCEVSRRISADRLVTTVDGALLVVGKFPCPLDHPVRPPAPR